jgi:hypothetical protein
MQMFSKALNLMTMIKELQDLSHLYNICLQFNMPEKLKVNGTKQIQTESILQ